MGKSFKNNLVFLLVLAAGGWGPVPVQAQKNKIPAGMVEKTVFFTEDNRTVSESVLSATPARFPLPAEQKAKQGRGKRPAAKGAAYKDRPAASLMYAAWSRYDVYDDFYDLFGFDIDDPTYLYALTPNEELVGANHQVCAAAWDGKQVQFISEVYLPSYDRYVIGYRGTLDLMTGEMKLLSKSGYASPETGNISSLTYDRTTGKLYGLNLYGALYDVSLSDSTARLIDTIRWGESTIGYPLTLSASPNGGLYVISSGGQLFRIDKRTAAAEKVGDLGMDVMQTYQSATFDALTGELFWARAGANEDELNLYKVDTLTGKAAMYSQFGIQALGLLHMYYDDACDVAPSAVDSLSRTAEGGTVRFRWINPSDNMMGGELTCLDKVRVYRAEGLGEFVLFDSVTALRPGAEAFYTLTETEEGYYRYGFEVVNTKGKVGPVVRTTDYGYYTYALPYHTGFEAGDNARPLIFDGSSVTTDKTLVYDGEKSGCLPPYTRLRVAGLPLEKGATYKVTFHSRGYEEGLDLKSGGETPAGHAPKLNAPWSKKPFATLNVRVGGITYYPETSQSLTWAKSEVEFYAPETIKTSLEFATSIFDVYYLDEVTIEAATPNTTPNAPHHVSVAAETGPSREVELAWTNPATTAGDAPLTQLSGVIVQMSQYSRFDKEDGIVLTDTVYTSEIGGRVSRKYTAPSDRYWYFRLNAFNAVGRSPYDTVTGTPWLGRDTVFDAPVGLQAACLPDGRMRLSWQPVSGQGTHGGWLDGEITGYRVIRLNGNNVSSTTVEVSACEYTTEVLPMNIYTFGVCAVRNGRYDSDTTSVRLIGGLMAGQEPVGDIGSGAGYAVAPFHASGASSGMSHISQVLYGRRLFDEPCIIDTLYFFMNRPALQFSQNYRIHLGYYDKNAFTEYNDWMAIDSMQEVFNGRISFDKQAEVLKVPVKPFWYDGRANLLLSVIRGKQTCNREVQFINNVSETPFPHLYDYHTESQSDFFDLHGKPTWASGVYYVPLMVVNKKQNLNTVKGKVVDGTGMAIAGARVEIVKGAASPGMDFEQILYTAEDGGFAFGYFPDNTYEVRISKTGFGNYECEAVLSGGKTETLEVTLASAMQVAVTGRLLNAQGNPVAGAGLSLTDREGVSVTAVSAADGRYVFEKVYGMTRYQLTVAHDHYLPYETEVWLEDRAETVLDDVTLSFFPFPARSMAAAVSPDGKAVDLQWEKPLRLSNKTVKTYHGAHLNNVCSSGDQTVAIRFEPAHLREMVEARGSDELVAVKFLAADSTADFTIHIYQGSLTEPAYSQAVGRLPNGTMQETFLERPFKIDTAAELLVGVFVPAGYKGCPFGKDAGPQIKNGAYINKGEGWKLMSDYMLPGSTSANWMVDAVFGTSEAVEAPGGYLLYRGEDTRCPMQWGSPLTTVAAGTWSGRDVAWADLSFGDYRYAVQADWLQEVRSGYKASDILSKDMYFDVSVRLVPEHPLVVGASIGFVSTDSVYRYGAQADARQEARFDGMRRGRYTLTVVGAGFNPYERKVDIVSDTTLEIRLEGVGNEEGAMTGDGAVYPNPSSDGRFTLQVPASYDGATLYVYGVDGRLRQRRRLRAGEQEVRLDGAPSGVYMLRIVSSDGRTYSLKATVR